MEYAKVENLQVTQIGLPTVGVLKNGCAVSGYNLLDDITLKNEDWLPYIENKPIYDNTTQYLEFFDYTITENEVIANYIVKETPPPEVIIPTPTIQEQIEQLRLEQAQSNAELIDLMIALTGGIV